MNAERRKVSPRTDVDPWDGAIPKRPNSKIWGQCCLFNGG